MGGTAVGAHVTRTENWRHRARKRALSQEQRGEIHWPRWVSQHSLSEPLAIERFMVASASRADIEHEVVFDAGADRVTCSCEAESHGQMCWHAGMVSRWLDYLASLMTPRAQAEARREQYQAWLDEPVMPESGCGGG